MQKLQNNAISGIKMWACIHRKDFLPVRAFLYELVQRVSLM